MKYLKLAAILLTFGAFCVLLPGCGADTSSTQQTVTVQRGNITTQITSAGNLEYADTEDLAFKVDCQVTEVLVKAGDTVKEGDVLCRFDETSWHGGISSLVSLAAAASHDVTTAQLGVLQAQQDLALAQQGVEDANNTIISLRIDYLQAQLDLQTAEDNLIKIKNSSSDPTEIEMAELEVELAQGQLSSAEANLNAAMTYGIQIALAAVDDAEATLESAQAAVNEAQASLDKANKNLNDAENPGPQITAPIDGLITSVNMVDNQEVNIGDVAFTIADPAKFEASIMVSEQNILKIKQGGQATVQVEVLSGVSIPATVSFVAPIATISSSVVNYEVKVELTLDSSMSSNQMPTGDFPGFDNPSGELPSLGDDNTLPDRGDLTQEQIDQMQQLQQANLDALADVQLVEGMTVTVSIITSQAVDVLIVLTQAITSEGGQNTVQVMVDGVAETRVVEIGISNTQYTQIISGLEEGEEVLVDLTSSSSAASSSSSSGIQQGPGSSTGGFFFGG